MTVSGTLAEEIVNELKSNSQFDDISPVLAYENEIKPTPILKPIVALSVKGCEIGGKITKTLENGEYEVTDDRKMSTTLSVDIYLPYSMGGSEGHKLFDRLATFFLFTKNYNITKAVCYSTDYDSSCEAISLRTNFVFNNTIAS